MQNVDNVNSNSFLLFSIFIKCVNIRRWHYILTFLFLSFNIQYRQNFRLSNIVQYLHTKNHQSYETFGVIPGI